MFRPIEHSNRFAAMDIVEQVVAGARGGERPELSAAVGMLLERGSDHSEAVAATATALQEDWHGRYGGANAAMMMAGAVAASRMGHQAHAGEQTHEDEALAAGRFDHLSRDRQEAIASQINRGTLLSVRDREDVSARYDARLASQSVSAGRGDGYEDVRKSIDMARAELAIGPTEWHGAGDRGAVSFLLHVQAPAMLRVAGVEDRGDPVNEMYVQKEAERMAAQGIDASGTIHGVRHNIELTRQMTQWLAPTLSAGTIAASAQDGPISRLVDQVDRATEARSRPNPAIVQAMAAGVAR